MTEPAPASRTSQVLLTVALLIVITLGIRMAADLVTILVVSLVLTLLTLPAVAALDRRGIPRGVAVAVVSLGAFLLLLGLVGLLVYALHVLVTDIGFFQAELDLRIAALLVILEELGFDALAFSPSSFNLGALAGTALGWVSSVGDLLMNVFFVIITTFFLLIEAPHLPRRAARILGPDSSDLDQASRMSEFVMDFMVVRTKTNFVDGLAFGGILMVMGVHAAVLWGVLTFLCGYVPYLGLLIAALPATFFAWLQYGLPGAIAVVLVALGLNLIVENPVFSYFASRAFEVPAVLVVLSVILLRLAARPRRPALRRATDADDAGAGPAERGDSLGQRAPRCRRTLRGQGRPPLTSPPGVLSPRTRQSVRRGWRSWIGPRGRTGQGAAGRWCGSHSLLRRSGA